ncbi:MAG: C1 family peptidase, partial [Nitrospinae bacterium]|nr:C1 family peptidase [Nitrospinota bacterium]
DWNFEDAVAAKVIPKTGKIPASKDLRAAWWKIWDQKDTGACVGFATADGVLRWHYVQAEKIPEKQLMSPRFIWMANKETDNFTDYPTTFIEPSGTSTKLALRVAQRYGCVLEDMLSMEGGLSQLNTNVFYSVAASYRINSYHNLGLNLDDWRRWLALNGPILTRLVVDSSWMKATQTKGKLTKYRDDASGGHAVCLVGYTKDHFVVRNSWGTDWGDKGFAYASNDYAQAAFTEAYGAVM